jgi:hypothetical protein
MVRLQRFVLLLFLCCCCFVFVFVVVVVVGGGGVPLFHSPSGDPMDVDGDIGGTISLPGILSNAIKAFLAHPHTHPSILLFLLQDLGRDLPGLVHPTAELVVILDALLRSIKVRIHSPIVLSFFLFLTF